MSKYKNQLTISITKDIVDEYNKYYKSLPRNRTEPIKDVLCPTINKYNSMTRMEQKTSKEHYKNFMLWVMGKNKTPKLMLNDCEITYITTYESKTRRDLDNGALNSKYYGDAFTKYGLLVDDSYEQVKWLHFTAKYKKGVRKLDIEINY